MLHCFGRFRASLANALCSLDPAHQSLAESGHSHIVTVAKPVVIHGRSGHGFRRTDLHSIR